MLTVVLDPNVLVSSLLSQKSWPAKFLDVRPLAKETV